MSVIDVIPSKCKLCYACVRSCPAKAIKIVGGHAEVIDERCINCGNCVTVCAPKALDFKSEKDRVKSLLKGDKAVSAIVAPSISGEFVDISNYRSFVGMIKALGFDRVNEVSFGVDLIAREYEKLLKDFKGMYQIMANCPVVVSYVEKYYPELVPNLSRLISPWAATAKVVRQQHGPDTPVVYIGPCVAAKDDARRYTGDARIDAVLTFTELRELFDEYQINETTVEYHEFDPPIGGKGSLFPISSGMLQAVNIHEDLLSDEIIVTEGKDNFLRSIKEFRHSNELKHHLDVFYCEGCLMGPGTSPNGDKFTRRSRVLKYVKKRLKKMDQEVWKQNMEKFSNLDFRREFQADDQRLQHPSEKEIQHELDAIGKSKMREQLGCGACGYPTCREFSIAINQGLAKREMCSYYSTRQMHGYIGEVKKTNRKLKEAQDALRESERKVRQEHNAAKQALETTKTMLQKLPTAVVLVNENLQIIESNASFINLLGEDAAELNEVIPNLLGADLKTLLPFHKYFSSVMYSGQEVTNRDVDLNGKLVNISVFTIKKNKIVGGIIRDLYSPEVQKDEVINRAKDVIKENLETVQQIAFLLGESASKTEKTLNSIIQAFKSGNHDATTPGK